MYWKNNVEAFRYYLVLESGKFLLFKIMIYNHKAWDYRLIIEEWAFQSLSTVISDGSHA